MCRHLYDLAKSGTAAPGLECLINKIMLPTTEPRAESRAEVRAEIPEEGAGHAAGGVGPPQHLSAQDVQDLFPSVENVDGEHTDAPDEIMTEVRHEVMTQVMTAIRVSVPRVLLQGPIGRSRPRSGTCTQRPHLDSKPDARRSADRLLEDATDI